MVTIYVNGTRYVNGTQAFDDPTGSTMTLNSASYDVGEAILMK
jgi:hypothetical protein